MAINPLILLQLKGKVTAAKDALLKAKPSEFEPFKEKIKHAEDELAFYLEHNGDVSVNVVSSVRHIYESEYDAKRELLEIKEYNDKAERFNYTKEGKISPIQIIGISWSCVLMAEIEEIIEKASKATGMSRLNLLTQYREKAAYYNMVHGVVWEINYTP